MTDVAQLEYFIKKAQITKRQIAKELCISETALYNKLNNNAEFKASEIVKMQEILKLTNDERDKIFFD